MPRAKAQPESSPLDNLVAELVEDKVDHASKLREHVRKRFDQALFSTRAIDQALVVLFTQGIEVGLSQKPKRQRKSRAKTPNGSSTVEDDRAEA